MAGARQRLLDRRARRAPLRADAGASAGSARRTSACRRRRAAALPAGRARRTWPTCASSTPTARRPSSRATARARRSCTCAAAAGRTSDSFSIGTPAGQDPPDDHRTRHVHAWTWARAAALGGLPRRPRGRARASSMAGRARVGLSPRLDRQPPVRDPDRRRAGAGARSTWPRSARRSKPTRASPTARTSPGTPSSRRRATRASRRGSARASSSAGWGRRSPRAPARAAPRSPTRSSCAGPRPRRRQRALDGGELEVDVGEDLRVNLTGWARPVFAGRSARVRKGAA